MASNKGFWSEMLGIGAFYYELGVQMIEACLATKPINGGLMEIKDLITYITSRRGIFYSSKGSQRLDMYFPLFRNAGNRNGLV